jgi:hypothetical protein
MPSKRLELPALEIHVRPIEPQRLGVLCASSGHESALDQPAFL